MKNFGKTTPLFYFPEVPVRSGVYKTKDVSRAAGKVQYQFFNADSGKWCFSASTPEKAFKDRKWVSCFQHVAWCGLAENPEATAINPHFRAQDFAKRFPLPQIFGQEVRHGQTA